ncbi:hypothetical protein PT974_05506 [Cladobotryum mycophilum]|uniref:Ankyrin repeat protein n=1 Tax=Cladobotryum mycophilum TaxID=491253 RepID=A0ABR0SIX1_9HYPO
MAANKSKTAHLSVRLPVEMMVTIASHLDSRRDKLNLSLVNRKYHHEVLNHLHNYVISCDSKAKGYSVLHKAIERHDFYIVGKYLRLTPVIKFNQEPRMPLVHIAVHEGRIDLLKMLLDRNDVTDNNDWMLNRKFGNRLPPLIQAARMADMADVISLLLSHKKVDKNVKSDGHNALWHAVKKRNYDAIKALLQDPDVERNGDLNESLGIWGGHDNEPLWLAMDDQYYNMPIIELLIKDEKTDLDRRNVHGKTALTMAIDKKKECVVEQIIATRRAVLSYRSDISAAEYAERTSWAKAFRSNNRGCGYSDLKKRYTGSWDADILEMLHHPELVYERTNKSVVDEPKTPTPKKKTKTPAAAPSGDAKTTPKEAKDKRSNSVFSVLGPVFRFGSKRDKKE